MGILKSRKKNDIIKIESKTIDQINTILQNQFSGLVIDAMTNDAAINKIKDKLVNDNNFSEFACHNNPDVAQQIVNEAVGFGVIEDILRKVPNVTDIGYNGDFLSVETNDRKFRYKTAKKIDEQYVDRLIQRFAVREGKQFNDTEPIFNGFSDNMRVSATYKTVSPNGSTMSLRISRKKLALTEKNFNSFAPLFIYHFLQYCVLAHCNIIISGETGTGKTELQKLLISNIPYQDKIIMIEDVQETHIKELFPDKDIYDWLTKGNGKNDGVSITDHIVNALRNNPKWLMVSETRGAEAWQMFQAVMSGHSLITTLHSASNGAVPRRFIGMSSMGYHLDEESVEKDFLRYMHLGVHIRKKIINGFVYRYCDELAEFVPKSEKYPNGINPLFTQFISLDAEGKIHRHWKVGQPTDKLKDQIRIEINRNIAMPKGHEEFIDEIVSDQHQKLVDEKKKKENESLKLDSNQQRKED